MISESKLVVGTFLILILCSLAVTSLGVALLHSTKPDWEEIILGGALYSLGLVAVVGCTRVLIDEIKTAKSDGQDERAE